MRRGALLAFAGVTAAAAILAVLGGVSLRQWADSAERLVGEQARDVAAMAAQKIEMQVRQAEDECLAGLQQLLLEPGVRPGDLEAWARKAGLVERVYLLDRAGRALVPAALPDDLPALRGLTAELAERDWERGGRRHVMAGGRVVLAAVLRTAGGAPVLAALVRDEGYLRREVLAGTLVGLDGGSVLAVLDPEDRPVYASRPLADTERVLAVPLGEALPTWRLALHQPLGLRPGAAVRRQAMLFTGAFALLLAVIALGLATTYRLVRRESEMARLKSDFVANVSHDLKTPLSLIRMFAETLELKRVTDEATRQEYYAVITRESERLTRLIDNVLDFSRIESGRRRYDRRPVALAPLVHAALEAFRHPLAQGGFTLQVDLPGDLPEIVADAEALEQALANLLDNAITYSGDGRRIRVEARRAPGEVRLAVIDDGIGIPAEEQARIFDKFYRIGRSDTQGRRGSGLGLALVKHVMDAHGGRVSVESGPARGSRFTLHLPLAEEGACPAS